MQCAWQMILKCETLPVRLHVSWVHTVYVTVSEDNQPMLPGVSQNVGCTRLLSHPASHLPAQPWSLQLVSAAALLHRRAREGWDAGWHESRQHASRGGGNLSVRTHPHTVILYTSLYEAPSFSHPHTHTHTHTAAHTQTPCGGFGNPSSDPNVSSQRQNQSPPPSSAAESSGARSVPASLFKSGLKRRADLHSTFTFEKKKNWGKTWWT